jgi:hypothetical protein
MVVLSLTGCGRDSESNSASTEHHPFIEHMAMGVSGDFVPSESSSFWQVWAADNSQMDLTGKRADCSKCHEPEFCSACHGSTDTYTQGAFDKALVREHWGPFHLVHPISDRSHLNFCLNCHETGSCLSCHQEIEPSGCSLKARSSSFHAEEARQNLSSCQICHPDGDICLHCHSARLSFGVNPHPVNWNDLKNAVDSSTCVICH